MKLLEMVSVVTEPKYRGKGYAAKLVDYGYNWAKNYEFKIIPTCSYITDSWLKKNPEWYEYNLDYKDIDN